MQTRVNMNPNRSAMDLSLEDEGTIMVKKGESKQRNQEMKPLEQCEDPIEVLMKDHDEGLKHLALMKNAVNSIRQTGFSAEAFRQIAEAIQFIDVEIRQHNELEEKVLFPLIERHGLSPSYAMRHEHREMWSAFNRLLKHVRDIEEGRLHGTSIVEFIKASEFIIDMLGNHIAEENTVLFPMIRKVLTAGEYQQLAREILRATARPAS